MLNKPLPYDLDIEKGVLKLLLEDNSIFFDLQARGGADLFYLGKHKKLYEKIEELFIVGENVNFTTICYKAKEVNVSIEYISEIIDSIASLTNLDFILEKLVDLKNRRTMIPLFSKVAEKLYSTENDTVAELDTVIQVIQKAIESIGNDIVDISDVDVMQQIEDMMKGKSKAKVIQTDIGEIDAIMGGFNKKNCYVICGRPAMGKSTLTNNLIRAMGVGYNVLYYSTEESKEDVRRKMISAITGIEYIKIKKGDLTEEQLIKIKEADEKINRLKVKIDDCSCLGINKIKADLIKEKGKGFSPDILIVDYLQNMTAEGTGVRENDENQKLQILMREFNAIGKSYDCAVLLLAQLNRGVEQRHDKRPVMSDLRGSGGIEQNADCICGLYRAGYYAEKTGGDNAPVEEDLELIMLKARENALKTLVFKIDFSRFRLKSVKNRHLDCIWGEILYE